MFTYWGRFKSNMDECEKGKTEISKTLKNKCKRQNRNFTFAYENQESVGAPLSRGRRVQGGTGVFATCDLKATEREHG